MIEVLKQALEALKDVGVLTDKEWQAVHKNKANELRQAIAEWESQEPMAWYCCFQGQEEGEFFLFGSPNSERYPSQYKTPLYEHLPQRTWVGLTDEEIDSYFEDHGWSPSEDYYPVIKAIEAKLKEKNT
jgi:hypothetical protein